MLILYANTAYIYSMYVIKSTKLKKDYIYVALGLLPEKHQNFSKFAFLNF